MHNRCPGHMVLCKITHVISAMSNSNGYYHNWQKCIQFLNSTVCFKLVFCRQTKRNICSQTEQILRHLQGVHMSDTNFVQSTHNQEFSPGQGVYQARVGITQILRNLLWVKYNHANSAQFAPFFLLSSNPVKN